MRDLLIGVSTREYTRRADFYDYLAWLEKPRQTVLFVVHDRTPAKARNLIVDEARRRECRRILFVDDDMAFRPNALALLLEHQLPVVSGLYFGRTLPHLPLIFSHFEPRGVVVRQLTGAEPPLIPIAAAGLGFCLMDTAVFDRLTPPYFRLGELDQESWSDDLGFFKRLQATNTPVYCDTTCRIGHIATMILWPEREPSGTWTMRVDTDGQVIASEPLAEVIAS